MNERSGIGATIEVRTVDGVAVAVLTQAGQERTFRTMAEAEEAYQKSKHEHH